MCDWVTTVWFSLAVAYACCVREGVGQVEVGAEFGNGGHDVSGRYREYEVGWK